MAPVAGTVTALLTPRPDAVEATAPTAAAPAPVTPRPPATPTGLRGRLADHLATPLARAGLALVASAGITSGLGLAYWTMAAHRYSPAAVGATAALLAAMEVVAAVANLGLRTALVRFVPALGARAPRVVAVSYAVAGLVAFAGAGVFVAVHGRWFPELDLLDRGVGVTWFLLSSVLWVIFSLQDSVLIGLRRSSWVPTENALYALAKLALLVGLTVPLPRWGIYVSWTAPLVVVVVAVNIPVFRSLRRPRGTPSEVLTVADLVRFSAGDYVASALWLLTIDALPLLVLGLSGAEGSAWYHLAWTVAYTLYLVSGAIGYALLAEGAHEPAALEANARRAMGQGLALVVPAAAVLVVAAPWLLRLFGTEYAAEGTLLLQLLAASAVPHVITGVYVNIERARRRIGAVIALYAVLGVAVVAGSALLVPRLGVTGAGVAWLAGQTAVAAWLLATRLRDLWVTALPTPVIRRLGAPGRWLTDRRQQRRALVTVPSVLDHRLVDTASWRVVHATPDLVVARVETTAGQRLMLKLPASHHAERARRHELDTLRALEADHRLVGAGIELPVAVGHGTLGSQAWSMETAVGGRRATEALGDGLAPEALLANASVALTHLHRPTARPLVVDDAVLRTWVDEPAAVVARACPDGAEGLARIAASLHAALRGRAVTVAWSHGDASPGNLLVDPSRGVTGVVDWEAARPDRLPELDLVTLIASVRAESRTREFGEVVLALLERPWTDEEIAALAGGPNPHLDREALVRLAWLHHVATNLAKSEAYAVNRVWVLRNVLAVTGGVGTAVAAAPPSEAPPPLADPDAPASVPRRRGGPPVAAYLVPVGAVVGWGLGLLGADPRRLTDLGLVSIVGPAGFAALAVLVVGFAVAVTRPRPREAVVAAHVGALAVIVYATPAVLYDTVRYSWAWKHIGIVDYIDRFGHVDPGIDVLPVYHNWPGFFAGSHLLQEWVGAENAIAIARWAPLGLGLATTAAVVMVAATFSTDRRVVWLAPWLFLLGDWVGQEYFSPQAYAYLLYLVSVALAVRMSRTRRPGTAAVLAVALMAAAIATSHQITPAMLVVAFLALVVTRQARIGALTLVALVATVTWALWGASHFVGQNLVDAVEGFGAPVANAEGNLTDAGRLSDGQALVVLAGRLVVVAVAALAVVGLARRWRRGERALAPVVLLVAPLVLLAANDFDGEILFRVYLFGLPFAAFFAAHALIDLPGLRGRMAPVVPAVVSLALLGGFLLAHFGKDGHYVFSGEEVAAATWLYETAPEGSLLVEGSRNYPTQFRNYEHFRYVPIDLEPRTTRREIARRPVRTLLRWMTDERDTAAYLLLTRSQQREADALGYRPQGFLTRIEAALRASDRFEIAFQNRDAVVFTVAAEGARP